jgi:hypothetical protein
MEAGQRRPTALQDKLWDEYMVAGNYGYFVMDKKVKTVSGSPYTWEKMDGNIGVASATRHGIIVLHRAETIGRRSCGPDVEENDGDEPLCA